MTNVAIRAWSKFACQANSDHVKLPLADLSMTSQPGAALLLKSWELVLIGQAPCRSCKWARGFFSFLSLLMLSLDVRWCCNAARGRWGWSAQCCYGQSKHCCLWSASRLLVGCVQLQCCAPVSASTGPQAAELNECGTCMHTVETRYAAVVYMMMQSWINNTQIRESILDKDHSSCLSTNLCAVLAALRDAQRSAGTIYADLQTCLDTTSTTSW